MISIYNIKEGYNDFGKSSKLWMLKDTNKEIQMELRKQALQVSNFHNHITKSILSMIMN